MNYKKYRIYLTGPTGSYFVATSDTVNNLVDLTKYWLERTSAGSYLPDEAKGQVVLQQVDETTGAYRFQEALPYKNRKDIITQVRKLGGR